MDESYRCPKAMPHLVHRSMNKTLLSAVLIVSILVQLSPAPAFAGRSCKRVGPPGGEQPDFCGCTIGTPFYNSLPANQVNIELAFGNQITNTVSDGEGYGLVAARMGAIYGDQVVITATYFNETLTRTIRLMPHNPVSKTQELNFAFPKLGIWQEAASGVAKIGRASCRERV